MRAADCNQVVGGAWLMMAEMDVAADLRRVESAANIADLPSRDDEPMWWLQVGARFVAPVVPISVFNFGIFPKQTGCVLQAAGFAVTPKPRMTRCVCQAQAS